MSVHNFLNFLLEIKGGDHKLSSNLSPDSFLHRLLMDDQVRLDRVIELLEKMVQEHPETPGVDPSFFEFLLTQSISCLFTGSHPGDSCPCVPPSETEMVRNWSNSLKSYAIPAPSSTGKETCGWERVTVPEYLRIPESFLLDLLKILGKPTVWGDWEESTTPKPAMASLGPIIRCGEPTMCDSYRIAQETAAAEAKAAADIAAAIPYD